MPVTTVQSVPVTTTGVPGAGTTGTTTAQPQGNAAVNTSYDPTPVASANTGTATGGGIISDFKDAVASLIGHAGQQMADVDREINQMLKFGDGNYDPAKLQVLSSKMARLEMYMQMAAKIEERKENSTRVFFR
jgi:hypothetical protein